jgi:hypothetical protein
MATWHIVSGHSHDVIVLFVDPYSKTFPMEYELERD